MSTPITTNGTTVITTFPGERYVVAISGGFGGGSMAVNWLDADDDATPYNGSPLTTGGTFVIEAVSTRLQLVLTGATAPTLEAVVTLAGRIAIAPAGTIPPGTIPAGTIPPNSITAPSPTTAGQLLTWSGTAWAAAAGGTSNATANTIVKRSITGSASFEDVVAGLVTAGRVECSGKVEGVNAQFLTALTVGVGSWTGATISGPQTFSSTSRPSAPSVTGIPLAGDLINYADFLNLMASDTSVMHREQMGFTAGSWANVGDSPVNVVDGINSGMARFIGTNSLASGSAQGGGIKMANGPYIGGSMTSFNSAFDSRFIFKNFLAQNCATAHFYGSQHGTQFYSNSSIGLYHVPQPASAWAASTVYALGDRINFSGIVYVVSTAGTSGGSIPGFLSTLNSQTADATVTWRNLGPHTSNKWALGHIDAAGVITLIDTGVAYVVNPTINNVLRIRSDGTTIFGSVNGSNEVSVARGTLAAASPFIMARADTGVLTLIAALLWTFSRATQ